MDSEHLGKPEANAEDGGGQLSSPLNLVGYLTSDQEVSIRSAPIERDWMELTGERYAYRCLPLNIANAHGWEILCASGFEAVWDGSSSPASISVTPDNGTRAPAVSHFGHGILTFHISCIFRTDPGIDLIVQGPVNRPKDAMYPLTGIIETDWSPYSFTMNWLFTRPNSHIRFEGGEPYCHIFPIRRGELEDIEPKFRSLADEPELKRQHELWSASRIQFNVDLKKPESEARTQKWQKRYYHGQDATGRQASQDHRTRLRLKPFSK